MVPLALVVQVAWTKVYEGRHEAAKAKEQLQFSGINGPYGLDCGSGLRVWTAALLSIATSLRSDATTAFGSAVQDTTKSVESF